MYLSTDVLFSYLLADLSCVIDTTLPSWSIDSSSVEVACYSLRDSLLKKFNADDSPSPESCRAALEKFLAVNERCGSWSLVLESTLDEWLINAVKRELDHFWFIRGDEPLISDYREIFLRGRAGPGASISARDTDFYTKMFDSPLSSTQGLPEIWERCVSMRTLSFEAEASRAFAHGTNVVDCSKYSFVNKTRTVARGICTEPTINMWFQLGFGSALEERLSSFWGIDLKLQPDRNRDLARAGSAGGCQATIDLESASDSMATSMLRELLPRSWMSILEFLRCPKTRLPTGSELPLNMVSTMGNGFTFPLQTILFGAVVRGVARTYGVKLDSSNFGVFGDDIICPSDICRPVYRVLRLLGFTVNATKSFVEGPFRESCGTDYYLGRNVRGVYLKQLRTQQDLYVAINLLNRWSAKTGVILNQSVTYLYSGLRRVLNVPLDENDDAGLHTPSGYLSQILKDSNGATRYKRWVPREYAFYILGGQVWTFKEQVRRNYNPAGLYISLLYGAIRGLSPSNSGFNSLGGTVLLRQRRIRYCMKPSKSPRWDWMPPRPFEDLVGFSGLRRLVAAWHLNLLGSGAFGTTLIP